MTITAIDLARELVRIESPTGQEGEVGDYLAAHLERLGYGVTRQEVSPGRFNVVAGRDRLVGVLSANADTMRAGVQCQPESPAAFMVCRLKPG